MLLVLDNFSSSSYYILIFENVLGSAFKLSSSNLNPLGLLVRQDGSLYEINAAKEDHKQASMSVSIDYPGNTRYAKHMSTQAHEHMSI
jgi:hypothetical protein